MADTANLLTGASVTVHRTTPRPSTYFAWVTLLSLPFWLWGVVWPVHALPFGLPVSVAMVVCPALAASVLTWQELGKTGLKQLWRRVVDVRRITSWPWLLIAVLCMPATTVATYAVMRWTGLPLPASIHVPLVTTPVILAAYFVSGILEEIGWTAYATRPMQARYGVLGAGLMIGTVWAAWHVVPWWIGQGHTLWWVAGQSSATILMRVLMGWIYAHGGGSVFQAILFHATINTTYSLFPNGGSHYNPLVLSGVLLLAVTIIGTVATASRSPRPRPGVNEPSPHGDRSARIG